MLGHTTPPQVEIRKIFIPMLPEKGRYLRLHNISVNRIVPPLGCQAVWTILRQTTAESKIIKCLYLAARTEAEVTHDKGQDIIMDLLQY